MKPNELSKNEYSSFNSTYINAVEQVCLIEGFKKHEIYNDDADIKRVVKDLIETIDAKREIKTRKYLKRTSEEDKKEKKIKTIAKSVEKKKYVKK